MQNDITFSCIQCERFRVKRLWGHCETSKRWLNKKLKQYTKLVPQTVLEISQQNLFAVISIYYVSFILFIFNHLYTKVFVTTGIPHWFAGLSLKSMLGTSLSKNASGIYYFPGILFFFFSNYHDIWRHFLHFVLNVLIALISWYPFLF